jgi:hypothetical protein
MLHRFARLAAAVLILTSVGCGSSDGPDIIWLRTINALPDAPVVRVSADGFVYRRNVPFAVSTDEGPESLLRSSQQTARFNVDYFGPNNQIAGTLLNTDIPVAQDTTSTVVLAGWFDEPQPIIVLTPRLQRPLGALQFQFVHAAPDFGPLDVYVTAATTELTATAPSATVEPLGHTAPFEVPFGISRIRLTPAGTLDVIMDSGGLEFGELTTATGPGAQWLFAIAPSVVPGPSPLFIISTSGRNNVTVADVGQTATLRAVHAVRDEGPLNVVAATDPPALLFSGLEYRGRTPRLPAPPGLYDIEYQVAGEAEPLASRQALFASGVEIGTFLVDADTGPAIVLTESQTRSIASEARFRFGNMVPESVLYSVYVTNSADEPRTTSNLVVRDLRYGDVTNHLGYPPGSFFLTLTERAEQTSAAIETVKLGPIPLELAGGDVRTYLTFPPANEGEPVILDLYDDRAP